MGDDRTRKGGGARRSTGGDPYTKALQDSRQAHQTVKRSLDKASKIAKRGGGSRPGRKG